jgi:hypothetical protein
MECEKANVSILPRSDTPKLLEPHVFLTAIKSGLGGSVAPGGLGYKAQPNGATKTTCHQGEFAMQNSRMGFGGFCALALLLSVTVVQAAPQDATANFVGTWAMTMTGGGQEGGAGQRGSGSAQSLTITQDGDHFKVSHKTRRGENAYDATVSGNTISWTEERQSRNGNTMTIGYKATLNGDTMQGTMSGGQFSRDFTAKRPD